MSFDAILRGSPRAGRYAQAVRVAKLTGIPVADVYARWKQGKSFCLLHGWITRKNHDCIICAGQRKQRPA